MAFDWTSGSHLCDVDHFVNADSHVDIKPPELWQTLEEEERVAAALRDRWCATRKLTSVRLVGWQHLSDGGVARSIAAMAGTADVEIGLLCSLHPPVDEVLLRKPDRTEPADRGSTAAATASVAVATTSVQAGSVVMRSGSVPSIQSRPCVHSLHSVHQAFCASHTPSLPPPSQSRIDAMVAPRSDVVFKVLLAASYWRRMCSLLAANLPMTPEQLAFIELEFRTVAIAMSDAGVDLPPFPDPAAGNADGVADGVAGGEDPIRPIACSAYMVIIQCDNLTRNVLKFPSAESARLWGKFGAAVKKYASSSEPRRIKVFLADVSLIVGSASASVLSVQPEVRAFAKCSKPVGDETPGMRMMAALLRIVQSAEPDRSAEVWDPIPSSQIGPVVLYARRYNLASAAIVCGRRLVEHFSYIVVASSTASRHVSSDGMRLPDANDVLARIFNVSKRVGRALRGVGKAPRIEGPLSALLLEAADELGRGTETLGQHAIYNFGNGLATGLMDPEVTDPPSVPTSSETIAAIEAFFRAYKQA